MTETDTDHITHDDMVEAMEAAKVLNDELRARGNECRHPILVLGHLSALLTKALRSVGFEVVRREEEA